MTTTQEREQQHSSAAKEVARHGKSAFAVLLALAIILGGGYFVYTKGKSLLAGLGEAEDYPGPGVAAVVVAIPSGTSVAGIGALLVQKDVIKSTDAWDAATSGSDDAAKIQAGSYRLQTKLPAKEALALLLNPTQSRVRTQVTLREGLTLEQQVADLAKNTKLSARQLNAALAKPATLGLPAYAANKPEGFLYPQTYEYTDQTTATALLKQTTTEFAKVTASIDFENRAKANGLTPYQAVIIASIIERESNRDEDRPKVARVIYNRLADNMRLQLDSTVAYANKNFTRVTTTDAERANPSPYNTYTHDGLPPGPISAPGKASLEAAVNPAAGDWKFFVAVNLETGETKFAVTAAEHDQYVLEFQAWCQANPGKGC